MSTSFAWAPRRSQSGVRAMSAYPRGPLRVLSKYTRVLLVSTTSLLATNNSEPSIPHLHHLHLWLRDVRGLSALTSPADRRLCTWRRLLLLCRQACPGIFRRPIATAQVLGHTLASLAELGLPTNTELRRSLSLVRISSPSGRRIETESKA